MQKLVFVSSCVALATALGCSSSSGGGSGSSDPFVGTWSCSGSVSLTFTMPAGVMPQMNTSTSTDTIVDSGGGNITLSSAGDAGYHCSLKGTVSGDTATIASGQTCSNQGLTISYKSASATLNGSSYTSQYTFDFSGTVTVTDDAGSQMVQVAGSGTGSDSCTKQ